VLGGGPDRDEFEEQAGDAFVIVEAGGRQQGEASFQPKPAQGRLRFRVRRREARRSTPLGMTAADRPPEAARELVKDVRLGAARWA